MRKTAITVGLLVLSASTSVGCKSAPKLAWWKSNKTDETALAHAAPELPSDAAKKAENAQVAGTAAPFKPANTTGSTAVASKSGSSYPSTDAPAFTPNAVTQVANTTPTTGATATTGASGPYDPAATPAPKAPTTSVATTGSDRYGQGSTAVGSTSPSATATAPPYGQAPSGSSSSAPNYSPTTDLAGGASRYVAPATPTTTPAVPNQPPTQVQLASTASTQPYRPGGTSSYNPVRVDEPRVAIRPESPTSTTPVAPATTPEAPATTAIAPATPASATPTTTAAPASSNRYW